MTELLPSGLEVASAYVAIPGADESERHRVWLYPALDPTLGGDGFTMREAVADLRQAFSDALVVNNPAIERYQRRLQTFASRNMPLDRHDLSGKRSPFRLQPSLGAILEGLVTFTPDDFRPTTELLGHTISRADLIGFTSHIMVNTALEEEADPRVAYIHELRAATAAIV